MNNVSNEVYETARVLTQGGFKLCPIPMGSKAPVTSGWQLAENCFRTPEGCEVLKEQAKNIGLVHEHSGTCCLDIDNYELAANYLLEHGINLTDLLASSPVAIVGKRGTKPLFRVSSGFNLTTQRVKDDDGTVMFELRAAGGQDVLPPSRHPEGITYAWKDGVMPTSVNDLPSVPSELLALWLELQTPKEATKEHKPLNIDDSDRAFKYCLAALAGEAARVASTAEGGRNIALYNATHALAGFIHPLGARGAEYEQLITDEMTRAGLASGLAQHEVVSTLRGAIHGTGVTQGGKDRPREIPEPSTYRGEPLSAYDKAPNLEANHTQHTHPTVKPSNSLSLEDAKELVICEPEQQAPLSLASELGTLVITAKQLSDEVLQEVRSRGLVCYFARKDVATSYRLDRAGVEHYSLELKELNLEALEAAIGQSLKEAISHDSNFLARDYLALADARRNRGEAVYPTGLAGFDKLIGGGFYDGLHVLGGATGGGKTALALHIAELNARAGRPVLFVSYEQSKYELWSRLIASKVRLNLSAMRHGVVGDTPLSTTLSTSEAYQDLSKQVSPHLLIAEGDGLEGALWGIERMLAHVRRIKAAYGKSPLIILDYLQRMPVTGTEKDRRLQVDDTVKAIQVQLGRGEQTPVLAISSLSRGNYGELLTEPLERRLEVFKESGGIEYSSYTASLLYRLTANASYQLGFDPEPDVNDLMLGSEPFRYVVLDLAKNREGDAGQQFCLKWYPKRGLFEQVGRKPLDPSVLRGKK